MLSQPIKLSLIYRDIFEFCISNQSIKSFVTYKSAILMKHHLILWFITSYWGFPSKQLGGLPYAQSQPKTCKLFHLIVLKPLKNRRCFDQSIFLRSRLHFSNTIFYSLQNISSIKKGVIVYTEGKGTPE